mmetsp:Transcript_27159/g.41299  ORF Transcript_27159/g.41299 Transcript_27159/m.41299 type:complete len:767 (-) Transcript_27159:145-2445(-)|eukprot:CAMPEP_0194218558 /NCGR_PEP_ID=MMETSP0156-20130528/24025_1 /TAXON_ID=33649 /ORGANISM="Thalassionema nitzschioides, Strain L26-B" /LENGTH=766 /DNA_ID=CAMNT_0038947961 /DNA_START=72 /DNA_END=2372 /DNA_ORIENTATION=+
MKQKEISCYFGQAVIFNKETNLSKTLTSAPVTLGSKDIYIGAKGNWKYKWNKVQHVHAENSCVDFETDSFQIQLNNADPKNWSDFNEFLQRRWNILCEKAIKKENTNSRGITISTTSWAKKPKPKKMYGSKSKVRMHNTAVIRPETEWSDDDHNILGLSEEEKEPPLEEEKLHNAAETLACLEEEEEEEERSVNINRAPDSKTKRQRLQKKIFDNDSDDDDIFEKPKMTILTSNRKIVTPHSKNALRFEDDDSEGEATDTETNQQKLSSFFQPKSSANADKNKKPCTPSSEGKIRNIPDAPKQPLTPLKQNNEQWIINRPSATPTTPVYRNDSKTPTTPVSRNDSKTRKFFSRGEKIDEISETDHDMDYPKRRKLNNATSSSASDTALSIDKIADKIASTSKFSEPMTKMTEASFVVPPTRWKGLRNLGNTCYLNASLQLIYTLADFVSSLTGHGAKLCQSITSISRSLRNATQASVSPRCLKSAVDAVTDRFLGYEQRDAHEFLSDLIDRVHDELKDEVEKEVTSDGAEKTNATDDFFRTDIQVCLKCNSCGYERTMQEMHRHLSIEVDRHEKLEDEEEDSRPLWKVEDGLKNFFLPTQLEASCEKCKEGTSVTRENKIVSRPKALILQLKRFVVRERSQIKRSNSAVPNNGSEEGKPPAPVEMIISKNKDPVLISEDFDLRDMVELDTSLGKDSVYKLSSVVHHHGVTPSSGHYTADAIRTSLDGEPEWVSFDDGQALPSKLSKLLKNPKNQRTSYLLLYTLEA